MLYFAAETRMLNEGKILDELPRKAGDERECGGMRRRRRRSKKRREGGDATMFTPRTASVTLVKVCGCVEAGKLV